MNELHTHSVSVREPHTCNFNVNELHTRSVSVREPHTCNLNVNKLYTRSVSVAQSSPNSAPALALLYGTDLYPKAYRYYNKAHAITSVQMPLLVSEPDPRKIKRKVW